MSYLDIQDPPVPCVLCERPTPDIFAEKHHLTPKVKQGKDTIRVCLDCGNQIHEIFTIQELKYKFNTLEALKYNEKIQIWIKWVRKKDTFGICMKKKKRKL